MDVIDMLPQAIAEYEKSHGTRPASEPLNSGI
jgi:hypothetical protein